MTEAILRSNYANKTDFNSLKRSDNFRFIRRAMILEYWRNTNKITLEEWLARSMAEAFRDYKRKTGKDYGS